MARQTYNVTNDGQITLTSNGSQNSASLATIGSYADLNAMFNLLSNGKGGLPQVTGASTKFWITGRYLQIMLKNFSANTAICDIYEYVPRRDIAKNFTGQWALGVTDQGDATNAQLIFGNQPYGYRAVTQCFKIVKKTRIILAAGGNNIIEWRSRKRLQVDNERVQAQSALGSATYKGISRGFFMVVYGDLVDDIGTPALGNISTGITKVGFVYTETYFWEYNTGDTSVSSTTNNFPAITVANAQTIIPAIATVSAHPVPTN